MPRVPSRSAPASAPACVPAPDPDLDLIPDLASEGQTFAERIRFRIPENGRPKGTPGKGNFNLRSVLGLDGPTYLYVLVSQTVSSLVSWLTDSL
jgi:hypothetical protein